MREKATVEEINGKNARLLVRRTDTCGSCNACAAFSDGSFHLNAINSVNAKKGDKVIVSVGSFTMLDAALLYFFPAISFILGYLTVSLFNKESEIVCIAGSFVSIILYYLVLFIVFKLAKKQNKEKIAYIVSIYDEEEESVCN